MMGFFLVCLSLVWPSSVRDVILGHDITRVEEEQRTGVCSHYFSRALAAELLLRTEAAVLHGQH